VLGDVLVGHICVDSGGNFRVLSLREVGGSCLFGKGIKLSSLEG
jgi:hypothetical protein